MGHEEHEKHEHHHGPGMGMMGGMKGMGGPMGHMGMMGGPMGMMGHHMGMCPWCGGMFGMGGMKHHHMGPGRIAKIAKKELLIERVKAKLEQKYGDELDKMADELINYAEGQKQMKADFMKRHMEMKSRFWEFMMGTPEEEEGEGEEEGEEE